MSLIERFFGQAVRASTAALLDAGRRVQRVNIHVDHKGFSFMVGGVFSGRRRSHEVEQWFFDQTQLSETLQEQEPTVTHHDGTTITSFPNGYTSEKVIDAT